MMNKSRIQALPTKSIRSNRWLAVGAASAEIKGWKEVFHRHGPVTPTIVRPAENGDFVVVAGERELQAARELNAQTTEAVVVPLANVDEAHKLTLQLLSLREAPHHLEQALVMKEILKDPDVSQKDVAVMCGRSVSWVSKRLRLVDSLQPSVVELVARRVLCSATAQQIAKLPPTRQLRFANRVVSEGLPKSVVERLVVLFNASSSSEELRGQIIASPGDVLQRIKEDSARLDRPLANLDPDGAAERRLRKAVNLLEKLLGQITTLLVRKPPNASQQLDRVRCVMAAFLQEVTDKEP